MIQSQFDEADNMTVMRRPGAWDSSLACTWDAWNRLVSVRAAGECGWDGMYFREGVGNREWLGSGDPRQHIKEKTI